MVGVSELLYLLEVKAEAAVAAARALTQEGSDGEGAPSTSQVGGYFPCLAATAELRGDQEVLSAVGRV